MLGCLDAFTHAWNYFESLNAWLNSGPLSLLCVWLSLFMQVAYKVNPRIGEERLQVRKSSHVAGRQR
jgi:hypothetical protein